MTKYYLIGALATLVALVSCSDPATPIPGTGRVTPQMRVIGGDLLLRMTPGGGPSELARRVASMHEESELTTARHVASVEWEEGRAELVVYRALDASICFSVASGTICGPGLLDTVGVMMVGEGNGHTILVGVPDGGVEVVFATAAGHTVSVLPLDGLAWAGWASRLGRPTEVSVFDANGEEVWHEEIDLG